MKKIMAFMAVLAMVSGLFSGCQTVQKAADTVQDWLCDNRVAIEKYVAQAQGTIDTIVAAYGDKIPDEWEAVYATAKTVVAVGQGYLDTKVCPDAADVAAVDAKAVIMKSTLKMAKKIQAEKRQRSGK